MRSSLVLFFALVIQILTSVATNPTPSTSTLSPRARKSKKYHPGDMVFVSPSAWETGEGRHIDAGSMRPHPAVVLGKNPGNNNYKVVHMTSNNLPPWYPHQDDARKYHPKAKPTAQINTGTPKEVAENDLQPARGWRKMKHNKLNNLKAAINSNCPGANLRRRGVGCPGHKPNRNTHKGQSHKPQGKKTGSKNAPQNQSHKFQGKKAGSKPNQKAPKGQVRQFKVGSKPNRKAPPSKARQLGGKKV